MHNQSVDTLTEPNLTFFRDIEWLQIAKIQKNLVKLSFKSHVNYPKMIILEIQNSKRTCVE